jgi:hypothetical protein
MSPPYNDKLKAQIDTTWPPAWNNKGKVMDAEELINQIVDIEWEMFAAVNNIGGPASCQNDPKTFRAMRISQACCWSLELLQSYLTDLLEARQQGTNLVAIKYARMMEFTHPAEYALIRGELPEIDAETRQRIEEIVSANLQWDEEVLARYPHFRRRGRPLTRHEDSPSQTSTETYMRGELQTLSPRSIAIYYYDTICAKTAGRNMAAENLEHMVNWYGYHSLQDAEEKLTP